MTLRTDELMVQTKEAVEARLVELRAETEKLSQVLDVLTVLAAADLMVGQKTKAVGPRHTGKSGRAAPGERLRLAWRALPPINGAPLGPAALSKASGTIVLTSTLRRLEKAKMAKCHGKGMWTRAAGTREEDLG